jgi:hypothetical protein
MNFFKYLINSFFFLKERDDLRRQVADTKKEMDKQTNILQKCLAVNKKLLVEKVWEREFQNAHSA